MPSEELFILVAPADRRPDLAGVQLVQEASPRVFVVRGEEPRLDALRGDPRLRTAASLPPAETEALSFGERIFIEGWLAGRKPKARKGEGMNWNAEGFEPP